LLAGWGYTSEVGCLLIHKVLGSIPRTKGEKKMYL
jgi:hypothetical protein